MRALGFDLTRVALLLAIVGSPHRLFADDAFYEIPLSELKIISGELPKAKSESAPIHSDPEWWHAMDPNITIEGPGEGYLDHQFNPWLRTWDENISQSRLAVRAPRGKDVRGQMALPNASGSGMSIIRFSIPASAASDDAQEKFLSAKRINLLLLADRPIAGKAWFRHRFNQVDQELTDTAAKRGHPDAQSRLRLDSAPLEDAYDLFSGGMSVAENLQLDRNLRGADRDQQPTIYITTLKGITTPQIDWKPLLKGAEPQLDPLSKLIPADQHVLFFPSFDAMTRLSDESKGRETVLLKLAQPQSEDLDIVGRYERQLGLTLTTLGRMVGPAAIKSIAITGSDSYFPTGTDVAVLFETDHPDVLLGLITAQVGMSASKHPGVEGKSSIIKGLKYQGFLSADREVSSYVARLNGAVVVTNSPAQLERLAAVGKGTDPISSLDEYKFFRTRYPLGDKDETAFLFLSDATIRRWCSPRWRIASARRTFTAAAIADLTCDNLQAIVAGKMQPQPLHTDLALVDAGQLKLMNWGVSSSTQGSLEFMTPIVELPIEKVTKSEADAYNAWRDGYERNWRWAFDPIALRIGVAADKLSGDLTVMPLIAGTEYREFLAISRGAQIAPTAGDPHDALAHAIMALNVKSDRMREWGNMASMLAPQAHIDAFGWLGSSIALYLDDGPIWKKLEEMTPEERDKFKQHALRELPVALVAEVSSPLKLTAFLAALRAFIEQTSPGLTTWESLTYRDQPYVRIKATEQARRTIGEEADLAIYYAPAADSLTITLSEEVLKHALDRRLAREEAEKKKGPNEKGVSIPDRGQPWLGSSLCLQLDRQMFEILNNASSNILGPSSLSDAMQLRSWSNIPILNQWKQLFPKEDPVKVHERLWHTRLICPGGGQYVWNDEWKTMESTVYGHPGQPKSGPKVSAMLGQFEKANLGVTFEDQGLRGRVELTREVQK
jgi:hypothetical protein